MRSQLDQLLFPEMMGKCFIINTPSLFSYVWAMFSPLVDARTRSKVGDYSIFVVFSFRGGQSGGEGLIAEEAAAGTALRVLLLSPELSCLRKVDYLLVDSVLCGEVTDGLSEAEHSRPLLA